MIKTLLLPGLVLAGLILAPGCSKDARDPCLQPGTTVLRARTVRHADTGKAILDTVLLNPQLRPLTGGMTQYIISVKRTGVFTFSLSNTADSCRWVLRPDSAVGREDTLTFYYERQLRFLSNACGYTNFYNLRSVRTTRHAIDSALILRPDITTDANVDNLRIFL